MQIDLQPCEIRKRKKEAKEKRCEKISLNKFGPLSHMMLALKMLRIPKHLLGNTYIGSRLRGAIWVRSQAI